MADSRVNSQGDHGELEFEHIFHINYILYCLVLGCSQVAVCIRKNVVNTFLILLIISFLTLTELPQSESIDMPDLVWRVLSVSAGAYGSHQLTGISRIVKTVISPLADCKVSVLVISTYQSDYVLVGF